MLKISKMYIDKIVTIQYNKRAGYKVKKITIKQIFLTDNIEHGQQY